MRGTVLDAMALIFFCFPVCAQQQDLEAVTKAINALNAQESEMIRNKDAAGLASMFTTDGLLVMLAPKLAVKPGREAIEKHAQSLVDAGVTNITLQTQHVEMRGDDTAWAAITYSVTIKDKTIEGNMLRMMRRESGMWKIAMESFARASNIESGAASSK
jgi:uncharacterized protein (TIGR02246 family)